MSKWARTLLALLVFAIGAPVATGDELVEAARKERARREALRKKREKRQRKDAAVVLSNSDLKRVTEDSKGVSEVTPHHQPAGAMTGGAAGAPGTGAQGETDEKGRDYWRERLAKAEAAVAEARKKLEEVRIQALEARRNVSAIDDPHVRQRMEQELRAAEAGTPTAQQALEDAERSLVDLKEEARRAGVPPGWLR